MARDGPDAGVHALRQCAHVSLPRAMPVQVLRRALNGNLPATIAVRDVPPGQRRVPRAVRCVRQALRLPVLVLLGTARPGSRSLLLGPAATSTSPAMRQAAATAAWDGTTSRPFASNPGYVRKRGTRPDDLPACGSCGGRTASTSSSRGTVFLYNMVRAIAGTLRGRRAREAAADAVGRDPRGKGPQARGNDLRGACGCTCCGCCTRRTSSGCRAVEPPRGTLYYGPSNRE
jgi:hypothetical protein